MEMETSELLHDFEIQKKLVRIISIVAAVVVGLWLGIVSYAYIYNRDIEHGYYAVEISEEKTPQ